MPELIFNFLGYDSYYWPDEHDLHIYILNKDKPAELSRNATNLYITRSDVKLINNDSYIPRETLKMIIQYILFNKDSIISKFNHLE